MTVRTMNVSDKYTLAEHLFSDLITLYFDEIVNLQSWFLVLELLKMKLPKDYKNLSKILLINTTITPEWCDVINLVYSKLEPLITGFNQ